MTKKLVIVVPTDISKSNIRVGRGRAAREVRAVWGGRGWAASGTLQPPEQGWVRGTSPGSHGQPVPKSRGWPSLMASTGILPFEHPLDNAGAQESCPGKHSPVLHHLTLSLLPPPAHPRTVPTLGQ